MFKRGDNPPTSTDQDTVGAPAGLCDRLADAVWVKLLQWCHGDGIPDLHRVSGRHQASHLLHDNTWSEKHTLRITVRTLCCPAIQELILFTFIHRVFESKPMVCGRMLKRLWLLRRNYNDTETGQALKWTLKQQMGAWKGLFPMLPTQTELCAVKPLVTPVTSSANDD